MRKYDGTKYVKLFLLMKTTRKVLIELDVLFSGKVIFETFSFIITQK